MRTFTEQHGNYQVKCYEVDITPLMRKLALDFSVDIISGDNQYNRLLPSDVNNVDIQIGLRIQRTYVGKLAELAFADFLMQKGINFSTSGMFQIYEGQENVDSYDFVMSTGEKIDVKCGFRPIHQLLAINTEQFDGHNHKDYYVAVKLNAVDTDKTNKSVDLNSITKAQILGYAEYQYLLKSAPVRDLGEGPARILQYTRLMGIDRLLNNF